MSVRVGLVAGCIPLALMAIALGCGAGPDAPPDPGAGGAGGGGGAEACLPGTTRDGVECVAAGVPPEACGAAFAADGRGGCTPILPAEPCPPGQIARLGQTACEPLADCGAPPWGNIPVEAGTIYVDASNAPTLGTGTSDDPFSTVQAAINAAVDGGMVAIAAGDYPQGLGIFSRGVRLWGRCPDLVRIGGEPVTDGMVISSASGTELHAVSVSASGLGLNINGAEDVVIDRVWIHDTNDTGVLILASTVRMNDSLIEHATGLGLGVVASDAVVERSEVRDTEPFEFGPGRGVSVEISLISHVTSSLLLSESLVHDNHEAGLAVFGATAELNGTAIMRTAPQLDGRFGMGIAVQRSDSTPASAALIGSVVSESHMFGVSAIDADVSLLHTTVEGVALQESGGDFGDGVLVFKNVANPRIDLDESRVGNAARAGVANFSSSVLLSSVALECNTIHLDGETLGGAFEFDDRLGNSCWCGTEPDECKVLSTSLEPPAVSF